MPLEENPSRILVIGEEIAHPDVTSFGWDSLPSELHLTDFTSVIISLCSFPPPEVQQNSTSRGLRTDAFARFILDPNRRLVFIGAPNTFVSAEGLVDLPARLLAAYPLVTNDAARRFDIVDQTWAPYLRFVSAASFQFALGWQSPMLGPTYLGFANIGGDMQPHMTFLATTTQRTGVAVRFFYELTSSSGSSGEIIWLPPTDDNDRCAALALSTVFGIDRTSFEPEWAVETQLPRERALRAEAAEVTAELGKLEAELADLTASADREHGWATLLFGEGRNELEPVVRAALRELGADVDEPTSVEGDDGRLSFRVGYATLEIKGLERKAGATLVRQASTWPSYASEPQREYVPLLVVAEQRFSPPLDRDGPVEDSALPLLRTLRVRALSTTQIFQALVEKQSERFDPDEWWSAVLSSPGVAAVPRFTGQADPASPC
jgi:hypothetical protein